LLLLPNNPIVSFLSFYTEISPLQIEKTF